MPELIVPTVRLHAAWLEAHREWGPGLHEDGFGLDATDDVDSSAGFAAWVGLLTDESDPVKVAQAGRPGCTFRWIVEGEQVLGGIALRHGFNDFVMRFGHIGYGVRPSARGRGVASWALGRMLGEAWALGMDRVLVVCESGNIASAKTIERNGGVLDDARDIEPAAWRYWIKV